MRSWRWLRTHVSRFTYVRYVELKQSRLYVSITLEVMRTRPKVLVKTQMHQPGAEPESTDGHGRIWGSKWRYSLVSHPPAGRQMQPESQMEIGLGSVAVARDAYTSDDSSFADSYSVESQPGDGMAICPNDGTVRSLSHFGRHSGRRERDAGTDGM